MPIHLLWRNRTFMKLSTTDVMVDHELLWMLFESRNRYICNKMLALLRSLTSRQNKLNSKNSLNSIVTFLLCQYIYFETISSIGRVFRPPLWRWRKMAALPLPVAILDDLISRKWGHPRWRPEAEGPPFSSTSTIGVERLSPSLGWRYLGRRHLGFKMATPQKTSGGRRDAREDVLQTSAPSMSPVEVWLYWKHLIVSLTQALSKWLSELPACYYAEVVNLHMSKVVKNLRLQQAPTLLFFWILFFIFFNCTLQ